MTIRQLKEALDKVCTNQDQEVLYQYTQVDHCQGADEVNQMRADVHSVKRDNNTIILS